MPRKSDKTKQAKGFGKGEGENYKPFIEQGDFSNSGSTHRMMGTKVNRMLLYLSNPEMYLGIMAEFSDCVVDMQEQFPLDINLTRKIAAEHSIRHPHDKYGNDCIMTTDLLLTFKVGDQTFKIAYTVKPSSKITKRVLEKFQIEQSYFGKDKWFIVSEQQLNVIIVKNLRVLREYFHKENTHSDTLFNFVKDSKQSGVNSSISDIADQFSRIYSITKAVAKEAMLILFARKKLRFDITKEFNWNMRLDSVSMITG